MATIYKVSIFVDTKGKREERGVSDDGKNFFVFFSESRAEAEEKYEQEKEKMYKQFEHVCVGNSDEFVENGGTLYSVNLVAVNVTEHRNAWLEQSSMFF